MRRPRINANRKMSDSDNRAEEAQPTWDENVLASRMEEPLRALEAFRLEVLAKRSKGWGMLGVSLLIAAIAGLALGAAEPPLALIAALGFLIAAGVIHHKFFGTGAASTTICPPRPRSRKARGNARIAAIFAFRPAAGDASPPVFTSTATKARVGSTYICALPPSGTFARLDAAIAS